MKLLIKTLIPAILMLIVSCGNDAGQAKQQQPQLEGESPAMKTSAEIDPICEMERDSTWTDYSVYKQDTIWFCSEGCKKAFEARPEKYIKG